MKGAEPTADAGPPGRRPVRRSERQRQHWWWWLLMAVAALAVVVTSSSRAPTDGVSDDRLFHIASQLKCVQCVGESVAGSAAPIAEQFRTEIREQMAKGRTNDEILDYFAARYDDVLLNPPATGLGSLVWVLPVVGLAAAVLGLGLTVRRWTVSGDQRAMTAQDERLVADALAGRGLSTDGGVPADGGLPEDGDGRVVDGS